MNHAPLPDSYYTNDLWQDSPLTDDEREALRDEIRQLVLGIKEEANIGKTEHSAIGDITLTSFRNEDTLTVTTHLIPEELETKPVGDQNFNEDNEVTASEEAHYLRDLGHEWEALEYDIIGELVLMLDLPELPSELGKYLLGGEKHDPCLFCTMAGPAQASFSVTAHIPETTQRIYDDAEFELARRLNIPIDGSSK
jgi:hypothetical protein